MYTSKSGKKFGSSFAGRKKDSMYAEKAGPSAESKGNNPFAGAKPPMGGAKPPMSSAHEAQESPEFEKGEQEGAQEAPEAVVAKHGPASSVHITHDRAANKHHVTSVHKNGHVHNSDHASAQEANDAGSKLGGAGQAEQAQGAAPEQESDGFAMPSLG
jgi:hypothetical protein